MGGKSNRQRIGHQVILSTQAFTNVGVSDEVLEFRYDDKLAWQGTSTGAPIQVNRPDLLGGDEREGGFSGTIQPYLGGKTQAASSFWEGLVGKAVPGWRLATYFEFQDCYWGNNPYLKSFSWLRRSTDQTPEGDPQWYPEKAKIASDPIDAEPLATGVIDGADVTVATDFDYFSPAKGAFGSLRTIELSFRNTAAAGSALVEASTLYGVDQAALLATWTSEYISTPVEVLTSDANSGLGAGRDGYIIRFGASPANSDSAYQHIDLVNFVSAGAAQTGLEVRFIAEHAVGGGALIVTAYPDDGSGGIDTGNGVSVGTVSGIKSGGWVAADSGWLSVPTGYRFLRFEAAFFDDAVLRDARVYMRGGALPIYQKNPVHIIRDHIVSPLIGRGEPVADIDDTNFRAIADILYDEGFGLGYDEEIDPENVWPFVLHVLDTIGGFLFIHRRTGLYTLTLVRAGDASVLSLTHGDGVDADLTFEHREPLPTRIELKWHDLSVRQDVVLPFVLEAAAAVNGVKTIERNRRGISSGTLAARVAERDLRSEALPLVRGTLACDRRADNLHPGDVITFTSARHGLTDAKLRVLNVEEGGSEEDRVLVTVVQDAFSFPSTAFIVPPPSEWEDPSQPPSVAAPRAVFEAPYWLGAIEAGQDDVDAGLTRNPDAGFVTVATGYQGSGIVLGVDVYHDAGAGDTLVDTVDPGPFAFLSGDLSADPEITSVPIQGGLDLDLIPAGSLATIGAGANEEIIRIDAVSTTALTVGRGCLDTVPHAHVDGTPINFWGNGYATTDEAEYTGGVDDVNVRLAPRSGVSVLDVNAAPVDVVPMNSRAIRPYPPGQLQLDGDMFPPPATQLTTGTLSWVDRNRLQQTGAVLLDFTDAGVVPGEPGVNYTVDILAVDANDAVLATLATSNVGAATSYAYDAGTWAAAPSGSVDMLMRVTSERGGYTSWQSPHIRLQLPFLYGAATGTGDASGRLGISGQDLSGAADGTGIATGRLSPGVQTISGAASGSGVAAGGLTGGIFVPASSLFAIRRDTFITNGSGQLTSTPDQSGNGNDPTIFGVIQVDATGAIYNSLASNFIQLGNTFIAGAGYLVMRVQLNPLDTHQNLLGFASSVNYGGAMTSGSSTTALDGNITVGSYTVGATSMSTGVNTRDELFDLIVTGNPETVVIGPITSGSLLPRLLAYSNDNATSTGHLIGALSCSAADIADAIAWVEADG